MRDIRIGVGVADAGGSDLDAVLAQFRAAEEAGFQSVWIPNIFGFDAMTLCALGGRETTTIEVGTAVVPTFSRHPLYLAQQALTTQAAIGGRFVLGLGPSHKVVIEDMLGLSFAKPARHVREYMTVVRDILDTGKTKFSGETYTVNGGITVKDTPPPPVLIGALGPLMRKVAGTLADGTITWMAGPRTLGDSIVPDLRAAAEEAGRPAPRVVAGVPVVLTDDGEGAKQAAAKMFSLYTTLPSYRAMLDSEGVEHAGEVALAGTEREIEDSIRTLVAAGVTDFHAAIFPYGPDGKASVNRTFEFLGSLAQGS